MRDKLIQVEEILIYLTNEKSDAYAKLTESLTENKRLLDYEKRMRYLKLTLRKV